MTLIHHPWIMIQTSLPFCQNSAPASLLPSRTLNLPLDAAKTPIGHATARRDQVGAQRLHGRMDLSRIQHTCVLEWLVQALICAIRNAYAKSKWKNMPANGSDKSIAVRTADLWINATHILTRISLFPLVGLIEIGLARMLLGSARSRH